MGALTGRAALIFGASSGIGRATAELFAREGAALAVAARSADALHTLCQTLAQAGAAALELPTDISQRAQVDRAVAHAMAELGDLDLVVNSAGTNIPNRRMAELRQSDWDHLLATNLTGAFNTTHAVLPHLRQRGGGLIVQIASVSGRWGDASGPAYQAAKAGVIGLCQGTMFEERHAGIRVSAVLPGLVDTPILLKRAQPPSRDVLDRALRPEDVARACLFLATLPPHSYVPELIILPGRLQTIGQTVS